MMSGSYHAVRREVVFDVGHAAFSTAFESLLGRTDVGAFAATTTPDVLQNTLTSFVGPHAQMK
jgi:hypothetical protein